MLYCPNSGHLAGVADSGVSAVSYLAFQSCVLASPPYFLACRQHAGLIVPLRHVQCRYHDYDVLYRRKPFQRPNEIGLLFSADKAKRNCECSVESGDTCDLQERHVKSINPVCAIEREDLMIPFPLPDGPLECKENGIDSTILRPMNPMINLRRGVKHLQENLGGGERTVLTAN